MNAWLSETRVPCGNSSDTSCDKKKGGGGGASPGKEKGKKQAEGDAKLHRSCLATADDCQGKEQKRRRGTRANPKKRRRREEEKKEMKKKRMH